MCVRPNDVSTSDSVTGTVLAASEASYSWTYAARASSDRNAEIPPIPPPHASYGINNTVRAVAQGFLEVVFAA
jgi:hypothetical protein